MQAEHLLEQSFVAFVRKWLPNSVLNDPSKLTDAKILLFVLIANTLLSFFLVPVLHIVFSASPKIVTIGTQMIAACVGFYILSFVILVRFGVVGFTANLALVGIFLSTLVAAWLTGGIYSPTLYLLLIPPVFAFVLCGTRSGVVWFVLSIISFIGIWFVDEFLVWNSVYYFSDERINSLMNVFLPVITCIMVMIAFIISDVNSQRLKKLLAQERNLLAFKATHDPLTNLANRAEFNTQIELSIVSSSRADLPFSLMYIDLDGFKPINDSLGHHVGDYVLEQVALRLRGVVRATDTVARLGGDEFAVILKGLSCAQKMQPIIKKILAVLAKPMTLEDGKAISITGSVGVAFYKPGLTADELCRQADEAMYKAKETKNRACFYQES